MSTTLALRAATYAQSLWITTQQICEQRIADGRRRDEGLTTLEIVIWGVGLFSAAGAAVFVIKNAITARTDQIK